MDITNIKEALKDIIALGEAVDSRLEDGKITLIEGLTLTPKVLKLIGIFRAKDEIIAEFKDLDEAEKEELIQYVKDELDLSNDNLEEIIEQAWAVLVSLSDLVDLL